MFGAGHDEMLEPVLAIVKGRQSEFERAARTPIDAAPRRSVLREGSVAIPARPEPSSGVVSAGGENVSGIGLVLDHLRKSSPWASDGWSATEKFQGL
jgi:hypothetical protein